MVVLGLLGWALGIDPFLLINGANVIVGGGNQGGYEQRASVDSVESNRLKVMDELQADCLDGVWANHAEAQYKFLDPGDIDAALQTAAAIGDDTLQRRSQGQVVPDSFTHGSAEQRKRWFSTGFKEGTLKACNTFAAARQ
jgi:predicted metalloprotease